MEKIHRPRRTAGETTKKTTGCGNVYVTVNRSNGQFIEVFATLGKAGGCPHCQLEAVTRCITMGLRYNVPLVEYAKSLRGLSCPSHALEDGEKITSCLHAIAIVIEEQLAAVTTENGEVKDEGRSCKDC